MDQQLRPETLQPWRFSLGSLLIAVIFAALACAAARFAVAAWAAAWDSDATEISIGLGLPLGAVPISLCAAIGVLRGRVKSWLGYGVLLALLVVGHATFLFHSRVF